MNNDEIYERGYEIGFDDGYNKALQDIASKFKGHIDNMIKNISEESINVYG